mmetsp:Transcript_137300/g.438103  ORF Transcript_137300/g.438103 Transcript_137300/m.438103 type:complete len:294 (+) Transcript_137300:827-1708(+)
MSPSPAHPHGRGGFKDMYILEHSNGQRFALKLLRESSGDLQDEVAKSFVAASYASTFDAPQHRIKFCVPVVVECEGAYTLSGDHAVSWTGRRGLLEPFLSGKYSKFLFEQTVVPHDIPQAFFHHSYESSGHHAIAWDLQGVTNNGFYLLTDPAIVCGYPGRSSQLVVPTLPTGVLLVGAHSIFGDHHCTFRALHTCNIMCAQLRLPPRVDGVALEVSPLYMRPIHSDADSDVGPEPFEHYDDFYSEPDDIQDVDYSELDDYVPDVEYSEPDHYVPDVGYSELGDFQDYDYYSD